MKRLEGDILIKCGGWNKQDYYVDRITEAILERGEEFVMVDDEVYEEAVRAYEASTKNVVELKGERDS